MNLESLKLYNFRCYESFEFEPDSKFNVIYGLNGQGKTSILEAISVLVFFKSFRNAKNSEILRIGTEQGSILGKIRNSRGIQVDLSVKLFQKRKTATINGKNCRYLSEYIGNASSVSFSPNDLEIVRGGPENRRSWIDRLSTQFDPAHYDLISSYSKILDHRNRLLKEVSEGKREKLGQDFHIWTDQLIEIGSKIIHNRMHSVDNSVEKIKKYYKQISNENLDLSISYFSEVFAEKPCGQVEPSLLELISRAFKNRLEESLKKELVLGITMVGPHRDDVHFKMNNQMLRFFGSQGEVRSFVLALRLTEVEVAKVHRHTNAILLIDDFSSELDERRRKFLLDYLIESPSQVFLSTTEELDIGKSFFVDRAKIYLKENLIRKGITDGYVGHSENRF